MSTQRQDLLLDAKVNGAYAHDPADAAAVTRLIGRCARDAAEQRELTAMLGLSGDGQERTFSFRARRAVPVDFGLQAGAR